VAHEVVFSPEAQTDLLEIYDYIAPRGGPDRALAYVELIQTACLSFAVFAERGT
jgi:toxin ParE1/3/4